MKTFTCDRCGKEAMNEYQPFFLVGRPENPASATSEDIAGTADLCINCYADALNAIRKAWCDLTAPKVVADGKA